jgi:hypothetical protein
MKRTQLTLFVDKELSFDIEAIRQEFNPLQYALIKSHVTLCREDELDNIERVIENLLALKVPPIALAFGAAVCFSEGRGVLLPSENNDEAFHHLRVRALAGVIEVPRLHEPHLTLMHPRNSTCTDEIFARIQMIGLPRKIVFSKISLIEQRFGGAWSVLREFPLGQADGAL